MGRGTSKASGGITITVGGSAGVNASLPTITTVLQPPTPQQVAQGNILPTGGVAFSEFQSMTDDEKADVINDALRTGVPLFLDDSGMQRFAYFTGMSDKPNVVSDSALDGMKGTELFRTVHNAYNRQTDIGYSAKDICDEVSKGDFTMYSDSGGSAYGKAIYFANNLSGSLAYRTGGKDLTMHAKITGGKGIDYNTNSNNYTKALRNNDKLAKACSRAGYGDAENLYALAKGYTHVTDNSRSGYNMILNRSCLTVSDTYKSSNNLARNGRW